MKRLIRSIAKAWNKYRTMYYMLGMVSLICSGMVPVQKGWQPFVLGMFCIFISCVEITED